jgi:saccharopine dehydrogenase-like NADP-dependent oxidoreductase
MSARQVLILGAGRSSGFLIEYLAQRAGSLQIHLKVADQNLAQIQSKIQGLEHCEAIVLDPLSRPDELSKIVAESTIVISLLPVSLHMQVAKLCLQHGKSFFTASYQSEGMEALKAEIDQKGLLFLNECGCDPGLDHMSVMQMIHEARENHEKILAYEGYTGGLVAPDSDDNPWHYKFSWNPQNVILAGQSGPAIFWKNNRVETMPYPRLFRAVREMNIPNFPSLVGYYNRNSLIYRDLYGISDAETVIRGTLRHQDFCLAWFPVAYLGLNLNVPISGTEAILIPSEHEIRQILANELHYSPNQIQTVVDLWTFLGFWSHSPSSHRANDTSPKTEGSTSDYPKTTEIAKATPASILENLLASKLSLGAQDRDMVLMTHRLVSIGLDGIQKTRTGLLCLEGEGGERSAMAKTVGWPLALAVELHLKGLNTTTGLQRPLGREWYEPILLGLQRLGVHLNHAESIP